MKHFISTFISVLMVAVCTAQISATPIIYGPADPMKIDPGFYGIITGGATSTSELTFKTRTAGEVKSKYDTTILFEGIDTFLHKHEFAAERQVLLNISCLVAHGPEGCDWDWFKEKQICVVCLKHINIIETRWVEPVKDKYQEALERLNKIK